MRNKPLIWTFVILLTLSVVYLLSFSFYTRSYESSIRDLAVDSLNRAGVTYEVGDSTYNKLYKKLLQDSTYAEVDLYFGLVGKPYNELKKHELNLGLDLKGGMSAVLEVSIADLFVALSDNHPSPEFKKSIEEAKQGQKNSSKAFVDLFYEAWKRNNTGGLELWKIFNNIDTKDKFKPKSTDDEVIEVLRFEAEDALNNTENIIKKRIEPFGITQANVIRQSLTGRIIVELPGVDDPARVRKTLGATANLEFWETYRAYEVYDKVVALEKALSKVTAPDLQSKDPVRAEELEKQRRAVLDVPGANWSRAQLDSINLVYRDTTMTPDSLLSDADKRRKYPLSSKLDFSAIQAGTAVMGYARASDVESLDSLIHGEIARQTLPGDLRLVWGAVQGNISALYAIQDKSMRGKAELDGSSIVNAREGVDPLTGDVEVTMMMDGPGTVKWREMTARNKPQNQQPGRQIAIVMDNRVYSAPVVNEEIPNGSSRITMGNGDGVDDSKLRDESKDLAELLKSGSLPAPAKIIDEVTVGPSIGDENITSGVWSFIIAFVLILIYMMFYYAWAGWAANVALIANLFFMFGALVAMHGSLTLPGIAGIVLTMGMAVDANVLIYERVKEELRNGSNMAAAMKDGFIKALSAIIDGNATTLITGIILFIVGTGPIKGFATTLIIGIFTTLLTALIVSRLILYNRLERKRPITFYSNITKDWFSKMNFDFVGKRKMFYGVSIAIMIAGAASWATRGFNMGVDFSGGTTVRVEFPGGADADAIRSALGETLVDGSGSAPAIVQSVGQGNSSFKVTTNYLVNSGQDGIEEKVRVKLAEAFTKVNPNYKVDSSYMVDPTMSDDFRSQAMIASILALVLVGAYILLRFRKWDFALGASVALVHDALVVIAAFTLLNGFMPFSLEVNQNFIGAILTVIGYSINDTVVIFDRIREYLRVRKSGQMESTINDALNSTMGRSINTSMTVLLTLLVMFFFGSEDIKGFCFAMIVGVISGVYSTLFIATPIVIDMRNLFGNKNSEAVEKA